MAVEVFWDRWPSFASALVIFGLAAWLLSLDFASRLHRSFALFLFVLGADVVLFPFTRDVMDLPGRLRTYFQVASPFAASFFAYVFLDRYGVRGDGVRLRRARWFPWTVLVCVVGCLLWNALDRSAYNDGRRVGPLYAVASLSVLVYAGIAVLLLRQFRHGSGLHHRQSLLWLSMGFIGISCSEAFYDVVLAWGPQRTDWLEVPFLGLEAVAAGAAILLLAIELVRTTLLWRPEAPVEGRRRLAWWTLLAAVSGTVAAVLIILGQTDGPLSYPVASRPSHFIRYGWSLALPILASFGLARYRLFDVDVRVRLVLSRSTIGGAFLAVVFIVSQLVQNFTGDLLGWAAGGIAGGLMLFALAPLQRLAEHVARRAVPNARPITEMTHEQRVDFYREQARLAWMDGSLSLKERQMLDAMRERLGVDDAEASRWEREITSGMARRGPRRRSGGAVPAAEASG